MDASIAELKKLLEADAPEGATHEMIGTVVHFISLVGEAANRREFVAKGDMHGKEVWTITVPILKADDEKKQVFGTVYSPDETDTDGDFMTAETIEAMAHDFIRANRSLNVDVNHSFKEAEGGYVCQSWVLKGEHPYFKGEKEGSWVVAIQVTDDKV